MDAVWADLILGAVVVRNERAIEALWGQLYNFKSQVPRH